MMIWIMILMFSFMLMVNIKLEIFLMLFISSMLMMKFYFTESQFEFIFFFNDSMSLSMVYLSFVLLSLCMIINWINYNEKKIIMCLLSGALALLMFQSSNFLLFFISFEASLIPLLILIFGWGKQPERILAGQFIMLYTMMCSFPLLCFLSFSEETEGIFSLFNCLINSNYNYEFWMTEISSIICISIMLTFLMKVPMFFIHSWLPKAHVEAPLEGSIILAGIMLKVGIYGILRMINFFSVNYFKIFIFIFCISLIGSILSVFMAVSSDDVKMSIALSSVSHMNFLLCSLSSMKELSFNFSMMMMISHGLISSMLFFFVTIIYEMNNSRSIILSKGLMSNFSSVGLSCFILFSLSVSIPPSISFLSELMIISSIMFFTKMSFLLIFMFIMINSFFNMMNYGIFFHSAFLKKKFFSKSMDIMFNMFSIMFVIIISVLFFFSEVM